LVLGLGLILLPLGCGGGGGETASNPPASDVQTWATALPTKHPNLYFKLPKSQYDQLVQQLIKDEPSLPKEALLVRWQAIVGAIGDEHTGFDYPELTASTLPIRTRSFPDGIYVVDATSANADLIGSRLESLGGSPAQHLQEALRPYIPISIEAAFQRLSGQYLALTPGFMAAAGILPAASHYSCQFTLAAGATVQRDLPVSTTFQGTYLSALRRDEEPASNYFLREDSTTGVVYVRYRLCAEMPSRPMSTFTNDVMATLGHSTSTRIIVDLRGNPGGNTAVLQPLLDQVKASPFNAKDKFKVLMDAGTFSSGFNHAAYCTFSMSATLLGENAGQALWSYGDLGRLTLPSGRGAYHSTKLFTFGPGGLSEPFHTPLLPDVAVPETIQDFRSAQDPVLVAAMQ
jgi:hypothetical protein